MQREEVEAISAEIARLAAVEPRRVAAVMREFGDLMAARQAPAPGRPGPRPRPARASRSATDKRGRDRRAAHTPGWPTCRSSSCASADPRQLRSFIAGRAPADHHARARPHDRRQGGDGAVGPRGEHLQAEVAHRIAVDGPDHARRIRAGRAGAGAKLSSVLQPTRETSRSAASGRWSTSSTAPTARPSARSSRGSSAATPELAEEVRQPDVRVRGHRRPRRQGRAADAPAGRHRQDLALALKGVLGGGAHEDHPQPLRACGREPLRGDRDPRTGADRAGRGGPAAVIATIRTWRSAARSS